MKTRYAFAAVLALMCLSGAAHAQAPAPTPALTVAVVVRASAPPLLTANGLPEDCNGPALAGIERSLRDLAAIKVPFAISASPVWVDELLMAEQTHVYAALIALATRHPLLHVPYANALLPSEPGATAVKRELLRGEDALQQSLQTASQRILDPPGLALSDPVLAVTRGSGINVALAPASVIGDRPVADRGVTLVPATDMPVTAPPQTLIDAHGTSGRIAVVARPDDRLLPALAQLAADKRIRIVNITDLAAVAQAETVSFDTPAPPPDSYRHALDRAAEVVNGFASYTLPGNRTTKLLSVLLERAASTVDWQRDWKQGIARAAAVGGLAGAERSLISASDGSVTLTSRRGAVPVTLQNRAPYPVRIRVQVTSAKLAFPSGDSKLVTVSPSGTTITFVAEARSTGSFPMNVSLESPDARVHFSGGRIIVRSTAANVLALVLTGSGLLFLVGWSSRDVIRRRFRRKSA
jgi:hypothetical protein